MTRRAVHSLPMPSLNGSAQGNKDDDAALKYLIPCGVFFFLVLAGLSCAGVGVAYIFKTLQ